MKLLLSAFVLFGAVAANAQVTSTHSHKYNTTAMATDEMEVQFKVGPGFNTVTNGDQLSTAAGNRTGLSLAADLNYPLTREFSILTGIEYIQKGLSASLSEGNNSATTTITLNYFEIPVLAQYNLGISHASKMTFGLGPYFALAASRSSNTDQTIDGTSSTSSTDIGNQTHAFDLGARAAVGFETVLTHSLNFVGGMAYDFGFLNAASQGNTTIANRSFLLDVGVGMKI